MMPGGGGRAVLESLRLQRDPPPVIIITGRLERSLREEVAALGAACCVEKPFDLSDLLRAISTVLASRPDTPAWIPPYGRTA